MLYEDSGNTLIRNLLFQGKSIMECLADHRPDDPIGIGTHIKHNRLQLVCIPMAST